MPPRLGRRRWGYSGTACPHCSIPLRHETFKTGTQVCPRCGKLFEAVCFTPVQARVVVPEVAGMGVETSAPCSTHARNLAVAACEHCGKFMCELCKISADGKVYCPACFGRLSSEGALASTVTRFKNYEGLALVCILFCWLFSPSSIVAVPLGIYYCLKGLSEKRRLQEQEGRVGLYVRLFVLILVGLGAVLVMLALFGAFR
jgi:uncharacterized Zn finger protein (UPF0148 family)